MYVEYLEAQGNHQKNDGTYRPTRTIVGDLEGS